MLNKTYMIATYLLAAAVFGLCLRAIHIEEKLKEVQKQAVELGHAQYNGTTGEWQWKEKK